MNRLTSLLASIGRSPTRTLLVAGTAVAAVAGGALIAIAVSGVREAQQTAAGPTLAPAASPTSSEASAPAGSPTPAATPSAIAPDATPPASPTNAATATPAATPAATPSVEPSPTTETTPTATEGGASPVARLSYDVTGTWETLASMPGGEDFASADSLTLADGRIVVFRWARGGDPDNSVAVYDPATDVWESVAFDGERRHVGTDQAFGLGGDGRIYTHDYRIDPSRDEWVVEPFQLVRETDVWAGLTLTGGADGRIYRAADDTGSDRTQLIVYDPLQDTFERSSLVPGNYYDAILPAGDKLLLFGSRDDEAEIIEYDPATDRWSAPHRAIRSLAEQHGAVALDGTVYVPGFESHDPALWAFSPDDDTWRSVQLPDDVDRWAVELLSGPDGRLYAFEREHAWAFTPDD